jgi:hypothetical protein
MANLQPFYLSHQFLRQVFVKWESKEGSLTTSFISDIFEFTNKTLCLDFQ